ncbi:YdcF family protein [Pelomyxa schiedti]|nr:YdcF family protein [Pelomyxa schiedti]
MQQRNGVVVVVLVALCLWKNGGWCREQEQADCSWVYGNHTDGSAYTNGEPIDVCGENAPAEEQMVVGEDSTIIIVPGDTPKHLPAHPISELEKRSLVLAKNQFETLNPQPLVILVSGGNVHPDGTPYNEAWEMRNYLVNDLGFPISKVVLEPYARHSDRNLRNAGRFMLTYNISQARVVCDSPQSILFIETVHNEEIDDLGYAVGTMERISVDTFTFIPSSDVTKWGSDAADP